MYLFLDEGMSPGSCPGVTNPHLPKPGPETAGKEMNGFHSQPGCMYPWAVDKSMAVPPDTQTQLLLLLSPGTTSPCPLTHLLPDFIHLSLMGTLQKTQSVTRPLTN